MKCPNCQTENADLKLHSDGYAWLVINGVQAIFRGEGSINNQGTYQFQVTLIDGGADSGDEYNEDLLRITIWEEMNGSNVVIYDSGILGLGGGQIKIH